jgi:hypothetical protein
MALGIHLNPFQPPSYFCIHRRILVEMMSANHT